MSTLLYTADTLRLCDEDAFASALSSVSEARRERALRYRTESDRRLCVAAELLLRRTLHDFGYTREPAILLGAHGKPCLADGDGVFFNLSHAGDRVLCAVSDVECGCDIERIREARMRVAERFFSASEYGRLISQETPEAQNELFFRLWTLRESYVKARGLGLSMPFDSFSLQLDGPRVSVSERGCDDTYSLFEYGGLEGYRCALCLEGRVQTAPELVAVPI